MDTRYRWRGTILSFTLRKELSRTPCFKRRYQGNGLLTFFRSVRSACCSRELWTDLASVRFLPEWIPGMSFKATGRQWRKVAEEFFDKPYAFVKNQMVCITALEVIQFTVRNSVQSTGNFIPSYTSYYVEKGIPNDKYGEEALKHTAGSLFAGSADTVSCEISFRPHIHQLMYQLRRQLL